MHISSLYSLFFFFLSVTTFSKLVLVSLIWLGGSPGWSLSSLGTHVILLVLSCAGSNVKSIRVFKLALCLSNRVCAVPHLTKVDGKHFATNNFAMAQSFSNIHLPLPRGVRVTVDSLHVSKKYMYATYQDIILRHVWIIWLSWTSTGSRLCVRVVPNCRTENYSVFSPSEDSRSKSYMKNSKECHNHKPQPTSYTKKKRKAQKVSHAR